VPVEETSGQATGVLVGFLGWDWAEDFRELKLDTGLRPAQTEILLAGRNGAPVALPAASAVVLPKEVVSAAAARPSGFVEAPCIPGERCLYGFSRLPTSDLGVRALDWLVVVRQPRAVGLALANELQWLIFTGAAAIAIALCIFGWLVAGRIAEPLRRLAQSAQQIAGSETPTDVPTVGGYREVATLGRVLRRMLAGLQQNQFELAQANATLEERVAQRTQELLKANADLTDEVARRRRIEAEREHLIHQLRDMAETDFLTGLMNRRAFFNAAARELAAARRYRRAASILLLDIDHFKAVNDRYGHQAGDLVLQRLAQVCRQTLRDSDLLARHGGEEFVALLQEADQPAALLAGERLRRAVENERFPIGEGGAIKITVSLGLAAVTDDTADLDRLLQRADQALYRAKAGGRNRVETA